MPIFYASFRTGFSVSQTIEYLREKGYETHSAKYILDKIRQLNAESLTEIFDCCREINLPHWISAVIKTEMPDSYRLS